MMHRPLRSRRRGIALIVIFVMVMLMTLAAYRFSFVMQSEYRLAKLYEEQIHARQAAWSGIEHASAIVDQPPAFRPPLAMKADGNGREESRLFRGELIRNESTASSGETASDAWKFALISPSRGLVAGNVEAVGSSLTPGANSESSWRWGLENESAKIPILALSEWERTNPGHALAVLSRLPGINPESIEPWLIQAGIVKPSKRFGNSGSFENRDPSTAGYGLVDQDYDPSRTGMSDNPIQPNNSSEASGSSAPTQWLGGDLNQNYRLDPVEKMWLEKQSRIGSSTVGRTSSIQAEDSIALQRYLTRFSGCRNERFDGSDRIYVNDNDLRTLHRKLMSLWPQPLADYVILVRQYGPTSSARRGRRGRSSADASQSSIQATATSNTATEPIDWNIPARYQIRSLWELVDATLSVPDSSNSQSSQTKSVVSPFSSRSGDGSNYLIRLLDDCTTDRRKFLEGKIDIWDAPQEVLMAIPEMDEGTANRIIAARNEETVKQQASGTLAWLLQRRIVDLPRLQRWEPYLTARSDVYTAQIIGFRDQNTSVYRCTATIDGSQVPARIRNLQTWHAWDAGFQLSEFASATE
ncbi:hypothetical protein SH449x_001346 [Pirellulaceae bacterium SH449]